MKEVRLSSRFKKEWRRAVRRGAAGLGSLDEAIGYLQRGEPLPAYFSDHHLARDYPGLHECHLDDDLLLIYRVLPKEVRLHRIGTHTELFTSPPM